MCSGIHSTGGFTHSLICVQIYYILCVSAIQTARMLEARVSEVRQPHGYRGRVRSGCLTCRSRKIRCDEMRPTCNNCKKSEKRNCIYKPRTSQQASAIVSGLEDATLTAPNIYPWYIFRKIVPTVIPWFHFRAAGQHSHKHNSA